MSQGERRYCGKSVAIVLVLALVFSIVGTVSYTLLRARDVVHLQLSGSQIVLLMHGIHIFAEESYDRHPTLDQWPHALIERGITDPALLVSPVEDGDGISYIYVPGPCTFDATQILIYEDPKHWPKRGVLVGFADSHVEFVPFDEFERMLFEQTNKEHD